MNTAKCWAENLGGCDGPITAEDTGEHYDLVVVGAGISGLALNFLMFLAANRRLFSVGDLIDRGSDSMGCLELLDEPWFHAVRGNHEDMLLTYFADPSAANRDWWTSHGGWWAMGLTRPELTKYADAISVLPLAIAVGTGPNRFNVVHAEFLGDDWMLDLGHYGSKRQEQMMWGRSLIRSKTVKPFNTGLSITYVGHTIVAARLNDLRHMRQFCVHQWSQCI